jgi:hypothetical protein
MAEPELSLWRRAWVDAKVVYATYWFKVPAFLLALGAILGAIFVPVLTWAKVLVAVLGGPGAPALLGVVVLLTMLALAPGRRRKAQLDDRLDRLEQSVAQLQHTHESAINAPAQINFGGTGNTYNLPHLAIGHDQPGSPPPAQESVAGGPPPELPSPPSDAP